MAAQAAREDRLAAADVVLDNSGTKEELRDAVDRLWKFRLAPFAANLSQAQPVAPRTGGPVLTPADPDWPAQAGRLIARLQAAAPAGHPGRWTTSAPPPFPGSTPRTCSTSSSACADLAAADRIAPLLAEAGFPRWPGIVADNPKPSHPDPADWVKRLHGNADPGRAGQPPCPRRRIAGLAVCAVLPGLAARRRRRPGGLPGREAPGRRRCTAWTSPPPATPPTRRRWFTDYAAPRMEAWAQRTGLAAAVVRDGPSRPGPAARGTPAGPVPPKAESGHPVGARR